jgi:uncharacterized protein YjiS (DUF1127 family)
MKSSEITFKTGVPVFSVDPLNRIRQNLTIALHTVDAWRTRARTRHALKQLSNSALNDIGVDRSEASHEADKPFWRA